VLERNNARIILMPMRVVQNELPRTIRRTVADAIAELLPDDDKDWSLSMASDAKNNAWDVELRGPQFHWMRRFSGRDRDSNVVAEAIHAALHASGKSRPDNSLPPEIQDALSTLASQGIAFTSETHGSDERTYIVDRVKLKESEILYLHNQHALTTDGIRRYLLTRG
jgi:hypothetical protein